MPVMPALSDNFAVLVAPDDSPEQARLQDVQLNTRVAQTGDLDHGLRSEMQECAARQPEQVNAGGEDVLPQLPGADVEPLGAQLSMQFGGDRLAEPVLTVAAHRYHHRRIPGRGTILPSARVLRVPRTALTCRPGTERLPGRNSTHDGSQGRVD